MNHDIEWLFEEVYKIKRNSQEKIHFISDWDVQGESPIEFTNLLNTVYQESSSNSLKYNYAYEQFSLKEQIINQAKDCLPSLKLEETELAITPSATISIYLTAQALAAMNIKRILIITPAYFSTHESFNKTDCKVSYYHLRDETNLKIDFTELKAIIKQQFIEGIVLTDPVYSAGIEFPLSNYLKLADICNKNNIYFIVDYSLGGLNWKTKDSFILNSCKISILKTCNRFLFIDTLSKRLLLNGIKFSVIIGDENIIDKIDRISETVYGGLSSAQCFLIRELYKLENKNMISSICKKNMELSQENYNLVKSTLIGTDFNIVETNSGYFSLVNHNKLSIEEIDTKAFSLSLLKKKKILAITKDRFTYFSENKFGFRVNLNKKKDELIIPLRQCIGIDYSRFNKR